MRERKIKKDRKVTKICAKTDFLHFFCKKFVYVKKKQYLCTRNQYIISLYGSTIKKHYTMLVQFKFNNYKCFKEETVFNVVASNYYREKMENLIQVPQYALLRIAAVYGANASGKTKLFQAFNFMREVVLTSADKQSNNWQKSYAPF